MQPSSRLTVKVSVKKRPYNNEPLMLAITASFNPQFTPAKALYFRTLSLSNLSVQKIDAVADQLKELSNAKEVFVIFSPGVSKYFSQ